MAALQPFATVHVTGPEAVPFLHSLTCNDVVNQPLGESAWHGLCSPKGRLLALFWLRKVSDTELTLTIDPPSQAFLIALLTRYRFRRKVTIEAGAPTEGPDWATFIANGWPWIVPENREAFLPQWVNLDLLGGVSFTKGCYPGQEVVARTRYLGEVKRRMVRVEGQGEVPTPGTPCFSTLAAEKEGNAGRIVLSAPTSEGFTALVSVRRTALTAPLAIGTPSAPPITYLPLPYPFEEPA